MSFRASANKVRNTELPVWRRLCELRHCFSITYAPDGYRAMVERYDTLYGFNRYHPRTDPPTEAQFLATLEALERERSGLLAARHAEAQRIREGRLAHKNAQRQSAPSYLFGMPVATLAQFKRTTAKSKPTLVFFGASWDANSARLAITLRAWKLTAPGWRLLILDAATEANWEQYQTFGSTTPLLLIFRQGIELARQAGYQSQEAYSLWAQKTVE
ncbi:thioredoxin family protein [Armatimonas sp.]|uniref:thioredoxin family protein n=1 Tax=Armatimonas sp. TaxID=1872638 RepID=UPI00374DB616